MTVALIHGHRVIGWRAFQLGLFFLASSALLAGLCFLVACIAGSRQRAVGFWSDPWLRPLVVAGVLMVIGAGVAHTGSLAWAGLANWLPFFWGFWGRNVDPQKAIPTSTTCKEVLTIDCIINYK